MTQNELKHSQRLREREGRDKRQTNINCDRKRGNIESHVEGRYKERRRERETDRQTDRESHVNRQETQIGQ